MDKIELRNLIHKVERYEEVKKNTQEYRQVWKDSLKEEIIDQLEEMVEITGLKAKVITKSQIENLEAVVLTLGEQRSGLFHKVNEDIDRHMIKHNGTLLYQQLFNGKIIVMINYPFIEDYGKPRAPKTIAIYRPEELKQAYLIRHLEEFVTEITLVEDFDDEEPNQKIGFDLNFPEEGTEIE
jgi:hypothetical protein